MKKYFLLFALLPSIFTKAQNIDNYKNGSAFAEAFDVDGKPFTAKKDDNIEGSPMLNDQWAEGEVKFMNGFTLKKVELQFNLFDNDIYFRKHNAMYRFADSVKQFSFSLTTEKGNTEHVLYRSGYPAKNNHGVTAFYKVLTEGNNFHLLQYDYKKLEENNAYNAPGRKAYRQEQDFFLYDAKANTITPVKTDRNMLVKALPAFEKQITAEFAGKKKVSVEDLVALVNKLNR